MTGRDLLCAIAEIDEGIVLESGQFSKIEISMKADRRRTRQCMSAIGIAAGVCIAVFGAMEFVPKSSHLLTPSNTTELQTPGESDPSATSNVATATDPRTTENKAIVTTLSGEQSTSVVRKTELPSSTTASHAQTVPTSNPDNPGTWTQTSPTKTPTTTKTHVSSTTRSTVPSSSKLPSDPTSASATRVQNPDTPRDVYQDLIVDYATAREKFAHPIKSCERSDFTNYRLVIVCPNGDVNASGAYCLSVTYVFTNGYIDLRDQSKMTEGITPTGNVYEYQGRSFYVHLPEFNGDRIRVEYFPTGKSGIAYQASFERGYGYDINEIMDLILSLEI